MKHNGPTLNLISNPPTADAFVRALGFVVNRVQTKSYPPKRDLVLVLPYINHILAICTSLWLSKLNENVVW